MEEIINNEFPKAPEQIQYILRNASFMTAEKARELIGKKD